MGSLCKKIVQIGGEKCNKAAETPIESAKALQYDKKRSSFT